MALPKQTDHINPEDGILILQDNCIRWISYLDFVETISLGGFKICEAVLNCFDGIGYFEDYTPPEDTPPVFQDIYVNLANRTQNFVIASDLFLNNYYDAEGDAFGKVIITGGDMSNVTFNNQPIYQGLIINADELVNFQFDAKNVDTGYQQVIEIDVYDENNVKAT